MITEQDVTSFENFLKSQGVRQELIDKLTKIARRTCGLPNPRSLRSSLDCIGSGIYSEWNLNYILQKYVVLFPSNLYRVPRKKKIVFNPYWVVP